MIKINAKKRLFADVKNLGITSNDIRKLFKLWDANILGVSTQDIVSDLELENDFTRNLYGTRIYESDEENCDLSENIDVSEYATLAVDVQGGLISPSYKLPKGANKLTINFFREIRTLPDEEDEYPTAIYKDINPYAKKAYTNAINKLKNACKKVENNDGYFWFAGSDYDVERMDDEVTLVDFAFELWFIPFGE